MVKKNYLILFSLLSLHCLLPIAFAQTNKADKYFEQGLSNLNNGKLNEAVSDFTQAIQLDPKTPEAYYNRGAAKANIFAKKNPLERTKAMITGKAPLINEAITDFTKAITIDANNFQYYAARGCAYIFIRNTKSAVIDLNKAISMDSTQANLYFHRGLARFLSGDIKGGWGDIDKSKKMGFAPPKEAKGQLEKLR